MFVDQEKAFDEVDRDFLYKIMKKLKYSDIFINFIKKIIHTKTLFLLFLIMASILIHLHCLEE